MPYQPTNPHPYNTGVDINDGLTFNFKVDNYDTINKFKLELYDLFKNEKIYTIVRTVGDIENRMVIDTEEIIDEDTGELITRDIYDISSGDIVEGDRQLIQILDNNNEQILLDEYIVEDESGISLPLNINNTLPISGGNGDLSVCELQLDKYIASVETVEKRKYYSNIENNKNLTIADESWFIFNENSNTITGFNPPANDREGNATIIPSQLVIPYRINGRIVEKIGDEVFKRQISDGSIVADWRMDNLETIVIPASVFSVGSSCFENAQINEVLFNEGNSEIKEGAFKNSTIKQIILLDSISIVGISAFEECTQLTQITLSHTLKEIPVSCFKNCVALTNIDFVSNIKIIREEAFWGCSSLTEIICVNGLEVIETQAFAKCNAVTNIIIPNSVQEIGYAVFFDDNNIIKIITPFIGKDRTNSISQASLYLLTYFFAQEDLARVNVAGMQLVTQQWSANNSIIGLIPVTLQDIELTDTINISSGAFSGCVLLRSVKVNNKVESIGDYAFYDCIFLEDFEVGESVTMIGAYAFGMTPSNNGGD